MATPRKKPEDILPSGRPPTWTPEALQELSKELMEFVERPDVWHISAFCLHKKKSHNYLNNIIARHPEFQDVLSDAHRILGNKMLKYCMETKQASKAIDLCMAYYLGERRRVLTEKKEDCVVAAEAAKEVMMRDPEHKFWQDFTDFMKVQEAEGKSK